MKVVVDTSALLAPLFQELDASRYWIALTAQDDLFMSAASQFEVSIVAAARLSDGQMRLAALLRSLPTKIKVRAVTASQSRLAMNAWLRFGKGRHPADLNFGDCFSYALAELLGAALPFKGSDFSLTPIRATLH